jgi:hypothetical protein
VLSCFSCFIHYSFHSIFPLNISCLNFPHQNYFTFLPVLNLHFLCFKSLSLMRCVRFSTSSRPFTLTFLFPNLVANPLLLSGSSSQRNSTQVLIHVGHMLPTCYLPCRNAYKHSELNVTSSLQSQMAPTCFGSSLPSSGSFLDPSALLEIQVERGVYHIIL